MDKSWMTDEIIYNKLNFKLIKEIKYNYHYIIRNKGDIKPHRVINIKNNTNLSKIYDSGKYLFVYTNI